MRCARRRERNDERDEDEGEERDDPREPAAVPHRVELRERCPLVGENGAHSNEVIEKLNRFSW